MLRSLSLVCREIFLTTTVVVVHVEQALLRLLEEAAAPGEAATAAAPGEAATAAAPGKAATAAALEEAAAAAPGEAATPAAPGEAATPAAPGEAATPAAPGEAATATAPPGAAAAVPGEAAALQKNLMDASTRSQTLNPRLIGFLADTVSYMNTLNRCLINAIFAPWLNTVRQRSLTAEIIKSIFSCLV